MSIKERHHWRLPDGVEEVLPPDARALELLRREVLDLFDRWGFDYVIPPMIEYLDALLVGAGHDLELQTFRMVDQASGRMLGIRADMTSQAARIDAASLADDGTRRLCYAGTVVHAEPIGVLESRVPLMAGAELFGAPSVVADAEIVCLMVETLARGGITQPIVELGHVGIVRSLSQATGLDGAAQDELFDALQRKSQPDIEELLAEVVLSADLQRLISALPALMGSVDVLDRARALAGDSVALIDGALTELATLNTLVEARCPTLELRFDLCELTGFVYHTGPVFAAYSPDFGRAIARGGRYDAIGKTYGRARPATGFDVDLKRLAGQRVAATSAVWAPPVTDVPAEGAGTLPAVVADLRERGTRVVCGLAAGERPPEGCDRVLTWQGGKWLLQAMSQSE